MNSAKGARAAANNRISSAELVRVPVRNRSCSADCLLNRDEGAVKKESAMLEGTGKQKQEQEQQCWRISVLSVNKKSSSDNWPRGVGVFLLPYTLF